MTVMHISWAGPFYRYRGWCFEWHRYMGPVAVYANGDERKVSENSKFWDVVTEFNSLPIKTKAQYAYTPK